MLPYFEVLILKVSKHLQQKDSFYVTKMVKHSYGWWIALRSQQAFRI